MEVPAAIALIDFALVVAQTNESEFADPEFAES